MKRRRIMTNADNRRRRTNADTDAACRVAAGLLSSIVVFVISGPPLLAAGKVSYNRDVRPILADKCLHCHGPDAAARQAELRLDDETSAVADRGRYRALVPGQPEQSELFRRIASDDDAERMPPPDEERQLTKAEIAIIRQWIESGGRYEPHWSYLPPQLPPLPEICDPTWPRNPIDVFVAAQLDSQGWQPAPEAEKPTLIRRVTLDLTGLPPTPNEVAEFLADRSPHAYEKIVDRLLESTRYGERMTLVWLDAARFADSGGYQGDILRSMWLWRDWVIDAYNRNLPFDQFTIEQLAGDLLPNPSIDQQIATGFNRNHRINDEDGIVHEEFRVEYVADRVITTAAVWLGATLECARCHDHKYDPISQAEFYRLYAYFNSIDEKGRGHGNSPPLLSLTTPEIDRQLAEIDAQLLELRSATAAESAEETAGDTQVEAQAADTIATLDKQRQELLDSVPTTMVMRELDSPRETFVLVRGAYDSRAQQVIAGTPRAIAPVDHNLPANRLGLARWLVGGQNPLTARVAVNRYWQMYFGRGIVASPRDFGSQGSLPTHPQLLDWLAIEFMRGGWNVKAMQRLIVTSATYRQSTQGAEEVFRRDPDNRWLARGPRFRLPAETIRDQALAASGLLVERTGGPSVKPYQPTGLWKELASAATDYKQSHGDDLYRRSLYTFVRRTVPPPAMTNLDAPNREICVLQRPRTNTPTQALTLMNDPTYVEAARALAERVLREAPGEDAERLAYAFRLLVVRMPSDEELATLQSALQFYRDRFSANPAGAHELIMVGESTAGGDVDAADLAAFTSVAMLIFNLDETITKE